MTFESKLTVQVVFVMLAVGAGQAQAEIPIDLVTASRAVLCLSPTNLSEAVQPAVANNQGRLRHLRCMRTEFGVPVTLMGSDTSLGYVPWQVRVHPQGIRGVTMWGYHSSFALPDGTGIAEHMRQDSRKRLR